MLSELGKIAEYVWKIVSLVWTRLQPPVAFDIITVTKTPAGGAVLSSSPRDNPFRIRCARYFTFGVADPILDATIVNHSKQPVLVTSIGVEVVSVAQSWWVGGVAEPHFVKLAQHLVVTMPDIWAQLEKRGIRKNPTEDIRPQRAHARVVSELPDPVLLDVETPFRFTIVLDKYTHRVPDYAIVRLWVNTNRGSAHSSHIYVMVPANSLHARANSGGEGVVIERSIFNSRDFAEAERLLGQANEYFRSGEYNKAEPLLREGLDIKQRILGEGDPGVARLVHNLGVLCFQQGKYSEAEEAYSRSIPILRKHYGKADPEFLKCREDLELLHEARRCKAQGAPFRTSESGEPPVSQRS